MSEQDHKSRKNQMASKDAIFFESRKQDHLRLALNEQVQALGLSGLDQIQLNHEALPDFDFSDITTEVPMLGQTVSAPIYISSMTAGHQQGHLINQRLASLSSSQRILMGVGSQRKELSDPSAKNEWKDLRKNAPQAMLIGNLGIAQIITSQIEQIYELVESTEALALFIHLNPLQEVLQNEGTPNFKSGLLKIEQLVKKLSVPVIVKEVGCGISAQTASRLTNVGVRHIDVAGLGGTHWGRIEGLRNPESSLQFEAAKTFENWGIPLVQSLLEVRKSTGLETQVWASGGVKSGLDVAKLLAMGANAVGMAQVFLAAATLSNEDLEKKYQQIIFELKIALFCMGFGNVQQLIEKSRTEQVWKWR